METIGERFKLVRDAQKTRDGKPLTQKALGEILNISRDVVANIENGRNVPTAPVVQLFCDRFNVRREWLETGEGEMFCPLSRTEEVAKFLNDLLLGDNSEEWQAARLTIIEALANMPPEFWKQAAAFIDEIARQKNKGQE